MFLNDFERKFKISADFLFFFIFPLFFPRFRDDFPKTSGTTK